MPGTNRLTSTPYTAAKANPAKSVLHDVILNDNPEDFFNRIPMPSVMPSNPKSLLAATRADNVHCNLWRRSDRKELKAYLTLNQTSPDTFSGEREEHLKREFALLAKCKFQVDTNTNELIAKVRIVLDGSRMIKGIHFTESYSPVISDRALKIIIHMCMIKGMRFYTTDIGNDYLRAEVDKDVRVFFPSYRRTKNGSLVRCIFRGNAYSKAQAGRLWYFTIQYQFYPQRRT